MIIYFSPHRVGTYGILNLIVGVIVESSLAFAKVDSDRSMKRSQLDRKLALSHLKSSFERMDADGSGITPSFCRGPTRSLEFENQQAV